MNLKPALVVIGLAILGAAVLLAVVEIGGSGADPRHRSTSRTRAGATAMATVSGVGS